MKSGSLQWANGVRPPAVAGMFYPGEAAALSQDLAEMMEQTSPTAIAPGFPKVLVVPHAGYIYSGPVAASAYDRLRPARSIIRRVVLLGPCHRVPVRGLALPGATAFDTPLGRIPIDAQAVRIIVDLPQVVVSPAAHAEEHSLEVQLPFLQTVLGGFELLPLAVGEASAEEVAEVIERLWGGPETLILISSDLSHYLPYDEARRIDGATAQAIVGFDTRISHTQACGATPLTGALLAARRRGLSASPLDLRNSGDTAGGRNRVVGYGSFAFAEGVSEFGDAHGKALLGLARSAIGAALGFNSPPEHPPETWWRELRATFVTLNLEERLRGCIGSLEARRPLGEDIIANARAAALQDPRFAPLSREEFGRTEIEVSVLSAPKRIVFENHADLIAQLKPGEDGIILEAEGQRATFLPQVWESLPVAEQFIAQLKQKAGIPSALSTSRCKVLRYSALKWSEGRLRPEKETGDCA
jgi:AmmeMemoRadiSam system protein B/AmmeMemoRadiSam system protein A